MPLIQLNHGAIAAKGFDSVLTTEHIEHNRAIQTKYKSLATLAEWTPICTFLAFVFLTLLVLGNKLPAVVLCSLFVGLGIGLWSGYQTRFLARVPDSEPLRYCVGLLALAQADADVKAFIAEINAMGRPVTEGDYRQIEAALSDRKERQREKENHEACVALQCLDV